MLKWRESSLEELDDASKASGFKRSLEGSTQEILVVETQSLKKEGGYPMRFKNYLIRERGGGK